MNISVNIKLKDVCLVTAGVVAGAAAVALFSGCSARRMKKEIVNTQTNMLRKEIKEDIKKAIKVDDIVKEIEGEIKGSIIDDTVSELNEKNKTFMAEVRVRLNRYEKELNKMSEEVLNFDARVGKIVNGAVKTVAGVMIKGGEDDED